MEEKRAVLRDLVASLGGNPNDLETWYSFLTWDSITVGGGSGLLKHVRSIAELLENTFPEHKWDRIKFPKKPQSYWDSHENQRAFLTDLGCKLGIQEGEFDKWYNVTSSQLIKNGGKTLISKHGESLFHVLQAVFPEHFWDESRFSRKRKTFWNSKENQRASLIEIGKKMGIREGDYDAWYAVTVSDLLKQKGRSLLAKYGNSPAMVFKEVFSEHKWQLWKFKTLPSHKDLLDDVESLRQLVTYVEEKLEIGPEKEKWFWLTRANVRDLGVDHIFRTKFDLVEVLTKVYPNLTWTCENFKLF